MPRPSCRGDEAASCSAARLPADNRDNIQACAVKVVSKKYHAGASALSAVFALPARRAYLPARSIEASTRRPLARPRERSRPPRLLVDAAEAEILDLEELLDAVFRALAADAAFLDAAERRDLGRDDPLVDADDAVFERLGNPPDAADVAAVEIGGEAELGVVRHMDRLVVALETVERCDRPEGFLLGNDHVGRHAGQHGRLEEAAAQRVAVPADSDLRAFFQRVA